MASWPTRLSGVGLGGIVATMTSENPLFVEIAGLIIGLFLTLLGVLLKWRQLRQIDKKTGGGPPY